MEVSIFHYVTLNISVLTLCCLFRIEDLTAQHVYEMLWKNFERVYIGETDQETGEFQAGNKAPWGLYMHAAWFFGQGGFKLFLSFGL